MHLIEINSSKKIDILENNKNLKVFMLPDQEASTKHCEELM